MLISYGKRNRLADRIRRFFGGMPCRVQVAALPWRRAADGSVEVLLVTSRETKRWVLPKGWPEGREDLNEAAAREAAEEAGVSGAIAREEIGHFFYGKKLRSGMEWRCQVHVFPLEVDQIADKWPERKKRKRQWFAAQDAARLVQEPDLGELIGAFGVNPRKFAA
jgi:8-oxo-dGTP pyrophosphatase MutT (NUDIX family)